MKSSAVKIIGTPISHYVETVILTCEEKGVSYTLQVEGHDTPVALKRPEHLLWHPFAKIPAAQIADVRLYETSAICRYIDLFFDGPPLVPREPLAAARMEQWISSVNCYFHKPCISNLVGHYVFPRGPGGSPDKAIIQADMPDIDNALRQLNIAYARQDFLAGNHISLADLFIAPIVRQMQQTPEGLECLGQYPAIADKLEGIFTRPGYCRAHQLFTNFLPAGHCLLSDEMH